MLAWPAISVSARGPRHRLPAARIAYQLEDGQNPPRSPERRRSASGLMDIAMGIGCPPLDAVRVRRLADRARAAMRQLRQRA
jgi:hypothetical protein